MDRVVRLVFKGGREMDGFHNLHSGEDRVEIEREVKSISKIEYTGFVIFGMAYIRFIEYIRVLIFDLLHTFNLACILHTPVNNFISACNVILHALPWGNVKIFNASVKSLTCNTLNTRAILGYFCAFPGVDFSTGYMWHVYCS